jgi:conjugative relaxase-like TrwC/TraI family protein
LAAEPRERGRVGPGTVAGFDLTFTVPKSASVLWALTDPSIQATVVAAHHAAVDDALAFLQTRALFTRTGTDGCAQVSTRGMIAAAFDHWDTRSGDPNLHTHVVLANKVQGPDGAWRSVDSRALHHAAVAVSELYDDLLADHLAARLPVRWGWRSRGARRSPAFEIAGIDDRLLAAFSTRAADIDTALSEAMTEFETTHGRRPTRPEVWRLRQQATLATRPVKELRPMADLVRGWRTRAQPHLGSEPRAWVAALANRCHLPALTATDLEDGMLKDAATVVVDAVAVRRATFTRSNVLAEALRQLHGVRFTTPHERTTAAERVTTLSLEASVQLTPPEPATRVPEGLQRADGSTLLRARDATIYTTTGVLAAEERLVEAGRATDAPAVPHEIAADVTGQALPGHEGRRLTTEQGDAVCRVVTSARALDVLVGAAGTGKSTAMAGVRAVWEEVHGRGSVVGLAPSAAAAEVLADAVGVPTENTTKWLVEHARTDARLTELASLQDKLRGASPSLRTRALTRRARQVATELNRWRLRPGQLVIVDEASMAGTLELDHLTTIARESGAKVLLVGDPAQLSPVAAGGAFRLLVTDRGDAPELVDVRRFRHEWERTASLALRDGRPSAANPYFTHGRITDGDRDEMLEAIYQAWRADTRAGRTSLMVAADAATVTELNSRARADLVAAGQVGSGGVTTADGTTIGTGDVVVTRRNQRDLHTAGGWVKNGDQWIVTALNKDGSLVVHRAGKTGTAARLPADYVREQVELGYATTAHRAQGRTVDTAHAYISAATVREPLYVMATRGREANRLYVDTSYDPEADTAHAVVEAQSPEDLLRTVLATSGADLSATQTRAAEVAAAMSPARLEAEGAAIQSHRRQQRYTKMLLDAGVSPVVVDAAKASGRWRPLLDQMRRAEQRGLRLYDTFELIHGAKTANPLVGLAVGLGRWITAQEANGPNDFGRDTPRTHRDAPRPEM